MRQNTIIESKNRENEELLFANRLRSGEQGIADGFAEVKVAFADIVGFTAMSSDMLPAEVVTLLNGLFTRFDEAAHELDIEKINTVGDACMAVCGLPVAVPNLPGTECPWSSAWCASRASTRWNTMSC